VIYLFLPIAVMIAFSFNNPRGRQNITWQGFTDRQLRVGLGPAGHHRRDANSLIVAIVATLIATVLGTLIGLALTRYEFRGRGPLNLLDLRADGHAGDHPRRVAAGDVGLASACRAAWRRSSSPTSCSTSASWWSRPCPHCRLQPLARGGGDGPRRRRVDDIPQGHLPAHLPGHPGRGAARLRALDRRLRDHLFVAGQATTFPLWVYGASRFGVPPEVNVLGTLIFAVALVFICAQILWAWRRRRVEAAFARSAEEARVG
jgi:spermidine/putrescine transport system permease protein